MIYLILTLLVYQAETKYFLTENKEGPVKHHHLVKIEEPPANKPEKKDEPKSPVDTNQKIGRNEKCPCGSEKKYKHCCGSV